MEVVEWYAVAKAMHLIGMVSWMAGLFYLVRLMVYHAETVERPEPERGVLACQYTLMEWKVYRIILQPAVVITWSFGVTMLILQPVWLTQIWMYGKLALIALLTGYTFYCKGLIRQLETNAATHTHVFYRVLNEAPTILMVAIIFLAVFKNGINWWYLAGGIVLFSTLIFWAVRRVANKRR